MGGAGRDLVLLSMVGIGDQLSNALLAGLTVLSALSTVYSFPRLEEFSIYRSALTLKGKTNQASYSPLNC